MREPERNLVLPSRRIVLLGASNVTRGISTVVETACRLWGRPLDVLAALGHGRSYGMRMGLLGRELPGIVECGLWEALRERPPAPTAALVTDVGNDLLYEFAVPDILGWVQTCLDRLQQTAERVVLTPLPLCNLRRLSPRRFLFFRTILFPGSRLRYATIVERAHALDQGLRDLAGRRGLHLVEPRPEWYGFDPIHLTIRHWPRAWQTLLAPWWAGPGTLPRPAPPSLTRWLYLRLLPPRQRWLFGWEWRHSQPAGRLADGTTLSYF